MITPTYLSMVEKLLFADETVEFTARQRRVGPGGSLISPSVVVATNERLLIVRDVLMLHIKQDIDAVAYSNITYTKIAHGLMSSTLVLGVIGYSSQLESTGASTFEIEGLRYTDAAELAQLIDKMIIKLKGRSPQETVTVQEGEKEEKRQAAQAGERWKVLCKKCNAKNDFDAHYCDNCGAPL